MLVIGERINVINKALGAAMKAREKAPIQDAALSQAEAGAGMLDVNLGPATRGGPETMAWLVDTIQEVTDTRLCLDTTNFEAMEAGLARCSQRPMINSTSAERVRLEIVLPLAKKYDAEVIGLAMTEAGISRDADERVMAAADIMAAMAEFDVPLERLYLDPLVLPVGVAQQQAKEALDAVAMFKQLNDPPLKTVVGLSNIYNGCPEQVRPALASTFLSMLLEAGLDAAIMDPLDDEVMAAARGERHPAHDRTEAILRNEMLYCHSYLG